MSNIQVAELCPATGVCPLSKYLNSVLRQGYAQWPNGRTHSVQGYVQWPGGVCPVAEYDRTHSVVRGMSSVREVRLCPVLVICPVAWRHNSALRQDMFSVWVAEFSRVSGVCLVTCGITLSNVRGMSSAHVAELSCVRVMSSVRMEELCPASGVCPLVCFRKDFFQN
ncbi:hypothetical protein TNCV_4894641 [Trichonephila clavipes]|nr:hypothetical protein TNCV_4894641 [Trichonephila clavipes]